MTSELSASVLWAGQDDLCFQTQSGTGHYVLADPDNLKGAKPTELVLMGLGSCASVDVVSILKKARQTIHKVTCHVSARRADAIPAVFTDIHLHFVVTGKEVDKQKIRKAIDLSAEKYCSISRMLENGGVRITHDFVLQEAQQEQETQWKVGLHTGHNGDGKEND